MKPVSQDRSSLGNGPRTGGTSQRRMGNLFQWSFNTGGRGVTRTGLQQTLTEGSLSQATMRRILKDTDAESGKDFFFLRGRREVRAGRGGGMGGTISLPRTVRLFRKTSQPEDRGTG